MFYRFNIRKIVIWLVIIMFVGFGFSGVVAVTKGLNKTLFGNTGKQYTVNQEESFDLNGINSIEAKSISSNINILPSTDEKIKVHFYGNAYSANNNAPKLYANKTGSNLVVEIKHTPTIGFNFTNYDVKLDIYVPQKYAGDLSLNSTSGEVAAKGLTINKLKASTVSGEIKIESLHPKETNISSTSGSLNMKDFTGNLSARTVSGEIEASYSEFNNNINSETTSGEVSIKLPENSSFNLNCSSVSGEITNSFPISISSSNRNRLDGKVGDSNNSIKIRTVSGSIKINK